MGLEPLESRTQTGPLRVGRRVDVTSSDSPAGSAQALPVFSFPERLHPQHKPFQLNIKIDLAAMGVVRHADQTCTESSELICFKILRET